MKSTSGRRIVPDYCATTSPENPNPEVVDALLETIRCMYDRVSGTPMKPGITQFSEGVSNFQDQIAYLEDLNAQLQKELARLNAERNRILDCLDEEVHLRANLEGTVAKLRQQINEIDQELCVVVVERDQFVIELENMKRRLEQCQNAGADLERERDTLYQQYQASLGHQDQLKKNGGAYNDLQQALADCCARADELTKQIGCLNAELNKANRERDELLRERDELQRKLNCLREKYETTKCIDDQLIQKLQDDIKCLEMQQISSCEKYKQILQAHHAELDRINCEKLRLENLYEEEKRHREDFERRLKDCEEQKRKKQVCPTDNNAEMTQQLAFIRTGTNCNEHRAQTMVNCGQTTANFGQTTTNFNKTTTSFGQTTDPDHSHRQNQDELNKMNTEKLKLENLYKEEKRRSEDFEKKLKDYEEQMKKKSVIKNAEITKELNLLRASLEQANLDRENNNNANTVETKVNFSQTTTDRDHYHQDEYYDQYKAALQRGARFIEQSDLDQLKDTYQIQLTHLQNKFEAQLEMNRQLAEINEQLGKQFKDRDLINSIRDSNEQLLRKELSSVISASKSDADNLRRIIDERDREVSSLRKSIYRLKHKYVSASHENEELIKKVQILASTSRDTFLEMDSDTETNNNL